MKEIEDLTVDHPFLKPIFCERQQVLEYDALLNIKGAVQLLQELKIKKNSILGSVCLKLGKLMLSRLIHEPCTLSTDVGTDTRMRLL